MKNVNIWLLRAIHQQISTLYHKELKNLYKEFAHYIDGSMLQIALG